MLNRMSNMQECYNICRNNINYLYIVKNANMYFNHVKTSKLRKQMEKCNSCCSPSQEYVNCVRRFIFL